VSARAVIARGAAAARASAPVALRIAGAGVVGAVIGGAVKRAESRLALQDLLLDAWESARALGELPVWESARRLTDVAGAASLDRPSLDPATLGALRDALPALTLLAAAIALGLTAARLWHRPADDAGEDAVDARPSTFTERTAFAMPAAVTALSRRLLQRRTHAARTPRTPALVPTLAATGADRAEIARRTGLSRDAVALSLSLTARQG
jgi:hypothetical protein